MDTKTKETYVIQNESDHMGGVGLPPEYLHKNGAETMFCAGIGHKALHMFESYGGWVFVGANGTVKEALTAGKQGSLRGLQLKNACAEHGHEHGHHH